MACSNCGAVDHRANNKKCPQYCLYLEKRAKKSPSSSSSTTAVTPVNHTSIVSGPTLAISVESSPFYPSNPSLASSSSFSNVSNNTMFQTEDKTPISKLSPIDLTSSPQPPYAPNNTFVVEVEGSNPSSCSLEKSFKIDSTNSYSCPLCESSLNSSKAFLSHINDKKCRNFHLFSSNLNTFVDMGFVLCPLDSCNQLLVNSKIAIGAHLGKSHPSVSKSDRFLIFQNLIPQSSSSASLFFPISSALFMNLFEIISRNFKSINKVKPTFFNCLDELIGSNLDKLDKLRWLLLLPRLCLGEKGNCIHNLRKNLSKISDGDFSFLAVPKVLSSDHIFDKISSVKKLLSEGAIGKAFGVLQRDVNAMADHDEDTIVKLSALHPLGGVVNLLVSENNSVPVVTNSDVSRIIKKYPKGSFIGIQWSKPQ
ncbi:hypothetical protein RCL1_006698 [Eukaryota sp. TZLM3-RCL]